MLDLMNELYPRGISLPKMAYEIYGISEIPKIFTRISGFPDRFVRDFRISRDFEGFPRNFLGISKVFKGVKKTNKSS